MKYATKVTRYDSKTGAEVETWWLIDDAYYDIGEIAVTRLTEFLYNFNKGLK